MVDNTEEGVDKIIKRNMILNTPKHCLQKCIRCKFKKRTCILDSSTCQAITKCCVKCKKTGHYPQSSFCKVRRNMMRKSKSKSETCLKISRSTILSKDVLLVVNKRVKQLEIIANFKEDSSEHVNHEKIIPSDLIPFVHNFL